MPAAMPLPSPIWRADALAADAPAGLSSGFARLDAHLPGGGWPPGALTELIAREAGVGELRLLVPLMARLTTQGRTVALLAPPHVPYAPALVGFGIDTNRLLVVQAAQATDRLWAVDQALRSAAVGALLAWLPPGGTVTATQLRRMQLAAASCPGATFLLRPWDAQFQPSPAPLRLLLEPQPNGRLGVRILKRRGPLLDRALVLDLPQPAAAGPITCGTRGAACRPSAHRASAVGRRPPRDLPLP